MMKLSSKFRAMAGVLVILVLSLIMAACGSPGVSVAETQTEEVKPNDINQEIEHSSPEVESSQENSTNSLEQMNQPLPDSRVSVRADFEVRPIEEVYTDGPPTLRDITGSDASLVFVSNIPLACSMVYGETTDYGMLTLDQDMAGGAHTNHHPIVLSLKPDTLYHYRLQGSAEDGTIYMSEDMTFRTPPAKETTEVNLASMEAGAQVIEVSSNYGGAANDEAWGANNAFDGSRGTEWSSEGDGNDAFVEIQLAQQAHLDAVEVWTRSMSNNTAQIFEFTLTTDSGEVLGPFTLPDANEAYRFEVDVTASTLRLDVVDSNGGNTGLVEFAAYGTPLEAQGTDAQDDTTNSDEIDPDDDMN